MYPEVKAVHILCAATSFALFAVRGLVALRGNSMPVGRLWRVLPHLVDTLLLACGVWLLLLLRLDPVNTPWLRTKLLCVAAYIALGMLAFRGPARWRPWFFAAALVLLGFIVSVAFTHDPRGIFSLMG